MSELAISGAPITIATLKRLLGTPTIPSRWQTVADCVAGIKVGEELGIAPLHSLGELYIVNGKVSMSGKAQLALILRAGHLLITKEMTPTKAVVTAKRRDPYTHELIDVGDYDFSWEEAEKAGLAEQGTYQDYPRDMLLWRAVGRAARFAFSDVTMGLMLPSELGLDPALDGADTEIGGTPEIDAAEAAGLVLDVFDEAEVVEDVDSVPDTPEYE
jgi:hypothetical protein